MIERTSIDSGSPQYFRTLPCGEPLLTSLLRLSRSQTEAIARELRDHLEERLTDLLDRGIEQDEAARIALEEFGDAAGLDGRAAFGSFG